jgi:hypothetical protein
LLYKKIKPNLKYLKQKSLALSLTTMSDPKALDLKVEWYLISLGLIIMPDPWDLGQIACLDQDKNFWKKNFLKK